MWTQEKYNQTILFVAQAHKEQKLPGSDLPYLVHLSNVAMEVITAIAQESEGIDSDLAMQAALLHDSIEDTELNYEDVQREFGTAIADGVLALTKNETLPKAEQMLDSLQRIKLQPREIGMVKLADRITNLQKPPHYWNSEKIARYQKEARLILEKLAGSHKYLENRLAQKIETYGKFI